MKTKLCVLVINLVVLLQLYSCYYWAMHTEIAHIPIYIHTHAHIYTIYTYDMTLFTSCSDCSNTYTLPIACAKTSTYPTHYIHKGMKVSDKNLLKTLNIHKFEDFSNNAHSVRLWLPLSWISKLTEINFGVDRDVTHQHTHKACTQSMLRKMLNIL